MEPEIASDWTYRFSHKKKNSTQLLIGRIVFLTREETICATWFSGWESERKYINQVFSE
jgi:hypothetical protein